MHPDSSFAIEVHVQTFAKHKPSFKTDGNNGNWSVYPAVQQTF